MDKNSREPARQMVPSELVSGLIAASALLCLLMVWRVEPAMALSLEETVRLALKNDSQRKADLFLAEAKEAEGWRLIASYGPRLDLSGSYLRSNDRETIDAGLAAGRAAEAGFADKEFVASFRQPLVDAERAYTASYGRQEIELSKLLRKKAEEDLVLKVKERYFSVLSGRENLRVAQSETQAIREQVHHMREKLALGFGTVTDQCDAEARYRIALAAEVERKSDLENAIIALEEVVAVSLDEHGLEDPVATGNLPGLTGELAGYLELAEKNNTDIAMAHSKVKAGEAEHSRVKGRFLPSLSLVADYTKRETGRGLAGYERDLEEFDVGLRMEMNLFAGGADTAELVSASRRVKGVRQQAAVAEKSVARSVGSLVATLRHNVELIEAYRLAVEAHRKAMDLTQEAYSEGVRLLLDLLNAQQEYYRVLGQYKEARYEYMVLFARLQHVVGTAL